MIKGDNAYKSLSTTPGTEPLSVLAIATVTTIVEENKLLLQH